MKILVMGSGAVGTLFGSILLQGGQDVTLVEKRHEIVEAIQKNGLKITRGNDEKVYNINITNDITEVKNPDLIMFCVKSYDNITAAKDCLKVIGENTVVLTLQNGIGNYEVISEIVGKERTLVGTTTYGSTQYAPGCTRGSEVGDISIGEFHGGVSERINKLAAALTDGGFTINTVEDVNSLIWTKLAVNVAINAVGALCRIKNGKTYELEPARLVQKQAVDEVITVAKAIGITMDYEGLYEYCIKVTQTTYANNCSMLQDVEAKNPTEVLAINGAVVSEGSKVGIKTPVNEVLTNLVRATEIGYS